MRTPHLKQNAQPSRTSCSTTTPPRVQNRVEHQIRQVGPVVFALLLGALRALLRRGPLGLRLFRACPLVAQLRFRLDRVASRAPRLGPQQLDELLLQRPLFPRLFVPLVPARGAGGLRGRRTLVSGAVLAAGRRGGSGCV